MSSSSSSSPVIDEAHRIAALFEYPTEEVNRGVKEFIREMDEGLEKDGTTLRQIPSYVTAVPDGTEKVAIIFFLSPCRFTMFHLRLI